MTNDTESKSPTHADDKCTIHSAKYVDQLEKRLIEQEQLIALLNEKISSLESGKGTRYADVVQAGTSKSSGGAAHVKSPSSNISFVGSKKTDISTVATVRYTPFFVSRLDPSLCAEDLAKDLLKDVEGLSSVKCCKLKTRHSSYSSFHVVVPEDQKQLVSTGDVWPSGSLVRFFTGRLLQSYVLESFDSLLPQIKSHSSSSASDQGVSQVDKVAKSSRKPPATSSGVKSSTGTLANAKKSVAPSAKTSNQRLSSGSDFLSPKDLAPEGKILRSSKVAKPR